jgi:hypothetical protein
MHPRAIAVFVAGLLLTASIMLPASARAQSNAVQPPAVSLESSPIGKVVTVSGSVTIEHANTVIVQAALSAGGVGPTKLGDLVYKGDVVQTGADGKVGITFTDGTAFNLSSNARMVLNEFVYDPNGKSNSTLFSLTKGTFTFIAGKVAKTGDMKIDTPVATMGIRGTTPHVEISDDGTVKFSTLIEEGKSKAAGKRVAPINQREAKKVSPSEPSSVQQPQSRLNKNFSINLNICRGC